MRYLGFAALALLVLLTMARVNFDLQPRRTDVHLALAMQDRGPVLEGLRIAVIADIHLGEGKSEEKRLDKLIISVLEASPDLVVLLGDYITHPSRIENGGGHRDLVARALGKLAASSAPVFGVLGNYEVWDGLDSWSESLTGQGVVVLHNDIASFSYKGLRVCIRGIGDAFTGADAPTDFGDDCENSPKITVTHDPEAAFKYQIEGLVFAGHTHCGQFQLPIFGAVWAPSSSPREAWCGLYRSNGLTIWTSSGVGTSVLPIRFFAPASWDLVTIN